MSGANKIILAIVIVAISAIVYIYTQPGYSPYNYPAPSASPAPSPTLTPTSVSTPTPTSTPAPTPTASPAPIPTLSPITYNISGFEFGFAPSAITAKAGQAITIVFSNNGAAPHNLTFEGLNIATRTINSGETDTTYFTAPAAGTYTFYCSVGSHRNLGMVGTLTAQ